MTAAGKGKPEGARPRSASRMAAVQALYQMDLTGIDASEVIDEFETHRFGAPAPETDGDAHADLSGADPVFFAELVRGVVRRQRDIDPLIDKQLATGWRLKRIDSILRAILRAGAFELMERPDVPARVAITEYINVAHDFFTEDEPRVVNGVLDAIARQLRPEQLGAAKSSAAK